MQFVKFVVLAVKPSVTKLLSSKQRQDPWPEDGNGHAQAAQDGEDQRAGGRVLGDLGQWVMVGRDQINGGLDGSVDRLQRQDQPQRQAL